MQDSSEIKVEFQMTEAEYLAATRLYFFNSRNVLIRIVVFWLLALVATVIFSKLFVDLFPMWLGVLIILLFQVFFSTCHYSSILGAIFEKTVDFTTSVN